MINSQQKVVISNECEKSFLVLYKEDSSSQQSCSVGMTMEERV